MSIKVQFPNLNVYTIAKNNIEEMREHVWWVNAYNGRRLGRGVCKAVAKEICNMYGLRLTYIYLSFDSFTTRFKDDFKDLAS
jgi:hypothetical protein